MSDTIRQSDLEENYQNLRILEGKYQKRIEELESEILRIFQEFESLQRENQLLRNKYETTRNGDVITEPYDIVNGERIALRAKVEKYKQKIDELKKERIDTFAKIQKQLKSIAMHGTVNGSTSVAQQKVVVVAGNTVDTVTKVKEENKCLTQKIEVLGKERDRQEKQIRKLEQKLKSIDERDLRRNTIVMDPMVSFPNAVKTNNKLRNPYFQARVHTVSTKEIPNPLQTIRPQKNPLFLPPLYGEANYLSLYKRRLSMMSWKTDLTSSSSSFRN